MTAGCSGSGKGPPDISPPSGMWMQMACDEVFVGYALIDHNGRVCWQHDDGGQHQDAAAMVQLADGSWRLLFGNGGIHCLDTAGTVLWRHPLEEAQHVVPGRFRLDSEVQLW